MTFIEIGPLSDMTILIFLAQLIIFTVGYLYIKWHLNLQRWDRPTFSALIISLTWVATDISMGLIFYTLIGQNLITNILITIVNILIGLGILISIVLLGVLLTKGLWYETQPIALALLVGWLASIGGIFFYKNNDGRGIEAAVMYVGFSVIVIPFMLLITAWISALLMYPTYY